jgi:hypothetical protein
MTARRKPHPSEQWDAEIVDTAAYFTACEFLGRGRYDRRQFPTLSGATRYAENQPGRRLMIYAVSPDGRSAFISRRALPQLCLPLFDHLRAVTGAPIRRAAVPRPGSAQWRPPTTVEITYRRIPYSGRYLVDGGRVLVTSRFGSRTARLGELPAMTAAKILLRELVTIAASGRF